MAWKMEELIKLSAFGLVGFISVEVVYHVVKLIKQHRSTKNEKPDPAAQAIEYRNQRKPPDVWNTVLIFPDPFFNDFMTFYSRPDENPTIQESTTYKFLQYFKEAKLSIFICIQLASFLPLERLLVEKYRTDGLDVRVITDYDSSHAHNNIMVAQLKQRGLNEIRYKNFGYLMHNKFVIIDDEAVITGSMNWTKTAFRSNMENVIVTTNERIVANYRNEFAKLWRESEEYTYRYQNQNHRRR